MEYKDIVGWVITVLASIIGWWFANIQLNKQNEKNLRLEDEKYIRDLQLRVSEEALTKLAKLREDLLSLSSFILGLTNSLNSYYSTNVKSDKWENPYEKLSILWGSASKSINNFIYFCESNEVILNKFVKMLEIFKEENIKLTDNIHSLILFLADVYILKYSSDIKLEPIEIKKLSELEKINHELILNLIIYIAKDYITELQNEFFSDIFNYKVPRRQPLDHKYKVLKVDD